MVDGHTFALPWFLIVVSGASFAQPLEFQAKLDSTLRAVDAILEAAKAKRVSRVVSERMGASLCEAVERTREPGAENRDFLCNNTTPVGRWTLQNLRADGGALVAANLEVRRFLSASNARAAKVTAIERYGGAGVSVYEGAISWCFLDVFWTEELMFSLWYGCHISLRHVPSLRAVRAELVKVAEPFEATPIIGVAGSHSGWGWALVPEGERGPPLPDSVRFQHFVKVVGVTPSDVLWLRERPQGRGVLGAKIDKLPPDASCVPLVFTPPPPTQGGPTAWGNRETQGWVVVKFNGREGWVNRRFLAEQTLEECRGNAGEKGR